MTKSLSFATKIVLHLVVIPRKIKSQHSFLRLKNEPPRQTSAALVKLSAQLPNRQPGVSVRIAKTRQDELQGRRYFFFTSGFPHNLLEPLRQFNENHSCSR